MLACARIGAPHSVVFGGFSADALRDRINDCGAKVLLTQDGAWRRGNVVPLKKMADEAVAQTPTIEKSSSCGASATSGAVAMKEGRDVWWHDWLAPGAQRRASKRAKTPPRSTPSTRSSSSTRRGRRASPRASSTRRGVPRRRAT
jgi:acyl-coenzyme A synthetase/AMP-(fatty) acid ligase